MKRFEAFDIVFAIGIVTILIVVVIMAIALVSSITTSHSYESPCDRPTIYSSTEMIDCLNREIHELQTKVAGDKHEAQ